MNVNINTKFIEILAFLVLEQNKQLLQIIAEEEGIGYKKINNFLPSQYEIKKQLIEMTKNNNQLDGFLEKSNSISESSSEVSSSEVSEPDVE